MTSVPVSIWVTEGTPVVTDVTPGGAVGIGMDKIFGGSVDNTKFMYGYVSMDSNYNYGAIAIATYFKLHLKQVDNQISKNQALQILYVPCIIIIYSVMIQY